MQRRFLLLLCGTLAYAMLTAHHAHAAGCVSPFQDNGGGVCLADLPYTSPSLTTFTVPAGVYWIHADVAGGQGALLARSGFVQSYQALAAGRVVIKWFSGSKLVASGAATITHPGRVKLTIRLSGAGAKLLRTSRQLRVNARGSFTCPHQAAITASRTLMLTR